MVRVLWLHVRKDCVIGVVILDEGGIPQQYGQAWPWSRLVGIAQGSIYRYRRSCTVGRSGLKLERVRVLRIYVCLAEEEWRVGLCCEGDVRLLSTSDWVATRK